MHVPQEVLSVLSQCQFSANQLILPAQLDRNLYVKTNKIIELAGGKWNRKAKAHLFDLDAESRIDQVILTASVDKPKDDFNFFPTPRPVISRMLDYLDIRAGENVLEPSCGDGRIVIAVHELQPDVSITAVELEPLRAADLRQNDKFQASGATLVEGDFLTTQFNRRFDAIPMNPPFVRSMDILHVTYALNLLADGGRLAAIMSAGVLFRETKLHKSFRAMVDEMGGEFEKLDAGAFKESGTMVNTVLLTLTK